MNDNKQWKQIRCENCGLRLHGHRRFIIARLSFEMQSLLTEIMIPRRFSQLGYICHGCLLVLERRMNTNDSDADDNTVPECTGHKKVCVGCGRSVFKKKSHTVYEDSGLTSIILSWNKQYSGPTNGLEVCMACHIRAKRQAEKVIILDDERSFKNNENQQEQEIFTENMNSSDFRRSLQSDKNQQEDVLSTNPTIPNVDPKSSVKPSTLKDQENLRVSIPSQAAESSVTITQVIHLPNYKRAANTRRRCVFFNCNNPQRLRIPNYVKELLLKEFNFYIPNAARVCEEHMISDMWDKLHEDKHAISNFNCHEIEDMLTISKNTRECHDDWE